MPGFTERTVAPLRVMVADMPEPAASGIERRVTPAGTSVVCVFPDAVVIETVAGCVVKATAHRESSVYTEPVCQETSWKTDVEVLTSW